MAVHTHDDIDWSDRLRSLRMAEALDAEPMRAAARRLLEGMPEGPTVLDVGCGAGGMSVLFAEELASIGAKIVLVDATEQLLAEAHRAVSAAAGERAVVETVHADVADDGLPAKLPAADLVWASRVVHHLPDQQSAIDTLARLARPGGLVAISEGGLDFNCLPWELGIGRPGLEERLLAARGEWFAEMRAGIPGSASMPYGWNIALQRAGLADVDSFGVLIHHPAPGPELLREFVIERVTWLTEVAGDRLGDDDHKTAAALVDPAHPSYLGARGDLFLQGAKTVHCGRRS
ncbi:bifunctional 2-polyprenyl-6-hydroxyphenol methylase/3-demethylubiquinol 3-O-methyltransferase UbiG [Amycolatopsis sp. TNS106]|uniref:class I SAM-dependent methyltransferase n=1 Tax=Amycolatopsis sp. TNS106 TaxID=2861750 RepID=UPI001C57B4C8|nr:class I SAM-dependent methyltransferase [Amycolatopsis sp. TNS106]QXV59551.1 SAM-dependent methyltransferase [Amycolatopsis sp. TNS106]